MANLLVLVDPVVTGPRLTSSSDASRVAATSTDPRAGGPNTGIRRTARGGRRYRAVVGTPADHPNGPVAAPTQALRVPRALRAVRARGVQGARWVPAHPRSTTAAVGVICLVFVALLGAALTSGSSGGTAAPVASSTSDDVTLLHGVSAESGQAPQPTPAASAAAGDHGAAGLADPGVMLSPASGGHNTVFEGTGSDFTPGAPVAISATMPDGRAYPQALGATADASGAFTWTWQWHPGDQDGTWTIAFLDRASGRSVSIAMTVADSLGPTTTVTPGWGNHSTLFHGTGAGFTPGTSVTISARTPNGSAYWRTFRVSADDVGSLNWSWQWRPGDPDGNWTISLFDTTSQRTVTAHLIITTR